jgi:hypothetical protein
MQQGDVARCNNETMKQGETTKGHNKAIQKAKQQSMARK